MTANFLRFKVSMCVRVFAAFGVLAIALMMLTYVPLQGVRGFAKHIKLLKSPYGCILDYPRAMAVVVLVEQKGGVTYQLKEDSMVSFRLYLSDLDETDIKRRPKAGDRIFLWLYVDADRAPARVVQEAQKLLRQKPFDARAFDKLPLTRLQKAMLQLAFLGRPFRVIALPKDSWHIGNSLFYIRMQVCYTF